MHSYLLTGIRMGPLMTLLRKNGFHPSPRNLGRLVFLFQNAFWSSIFTWREKKIYSEKLKTYRAPDDPVVIIGHWRTGSTYLQQLLSLDDRFITPTLFQTSFPDSYLVSERFYRPVMGTIVTSRPMDNVKFGFDAPHEDEFALLKLTLDSPLLNIIFPEKPGFFMNDFEDFNPSDDKKELWKEKTKAYCAKICGNTGKILLLKNPAHSLRIPFLAEVFPRARFIHLHRHPYQVAASSLHLWKVMANDNQLKGRAYYPGLQEVTEGLIKFYKVIRRDLAAIAPDRQCEINYENLENEPVETVREIYKALGLDYTTDFEGRLRSFPDNNRDFKKNTYNFDDEQKALVYQMMKKQFDDYQYKS